MKEFQSGRGLLSKRDDGRINKKDLDEGSSVVNEGGFPSPNAPINDKPHPPHLGRGGGYVGLRSYNLCPMVGESPNDTN